MNLTPRLASPKAHCTIQQVLRSFAAVVVFGVAGPPIGGLVAWGMMGAAGGNSPAPFVSGAYGEGLALALATGIIVAAAAWLGHSSWLIAVAAALLTNLVFHLSTVTAGFASPEYFEALARTAMVFLPPSVVAALACRFLARPLLEGS